MNELTSCEIVCVNDWNEESDCCDNVVNCANLTGMAKTGRPEVEQPLK